jgi:hypothetical protein
MTVNSMLQAGLYFLVLILLEKPLGAFMARVYSGEKTWLDPFVGPVERLLYRLAGIDPAAEMGWKAYTGAMLAFNLHIHRNRAVLSLDSSGDSLHKRGYRPIQTRAPLNEALAGLREVHRFGALLWGCQRVEAEPHLTHAPLELFLMADLMLPQHLPDLPGAAGTGAGGHVVGPELAQ